MYSLVYGASAIPALGRLAAKLVFQRSSFAFQFIRRLLLSKK